MVIDRLPWLFYVIRSFAVLWPAVLDMGAECKPARNRRDETIRVRIPDDTDGAGNKVEKEYLPYTLDGWEVTSLITNGDPHTLLSSD